MALESKNAFVGNSIGTLRRSAPDLNALPRFFRDKISFFNAVKWWSDSRESPLLELLPWRQSKVDRRCYGMRLEACFIFHGIGERQRWLVRRGNFRSQSLKTLFFATWSISVWLVMAGLRIQLWTSGPDIDAYLNKCSFPKKNKIDRHCSRYLLGRHLSPPQKIRNTVKNLVLWICIVTQRC